MTSAPDIRAAVCQEARRWLGTPWHHRARVMGAGVDCAHLLIAVYESVGLLRPGQIDPGPYPMDWFLHSDDDRFLRAMSSAGRPVAAPRPGDAALFRFGRVSSHAAIVLEPGLILHAYAPEGAVVISDLRTCAALAERLVGHYSLIGLSRG